MSALTVIESYWTRHDLPEDLYQAITDVRGLVAAAGAGEEALRFAGSALDADHLHDARVRVGGAA